MKLQKRLNNIILLLSIAAAGSASAADLFSSGTKTWNTSNVNWGTVTGGPYDTSTWSNGDSAFLEGTQGTLTLGSDFSLDRMAITGNTASAINYVVGNTAGNQTLTFTGTKTLTINTVDATINTGVSGTPALAYNIRPNNGADLILNPGALTQNFSSLTVTKNATNTNAALTLDGSSSGNLTGLITWSAGAHQLLVDKKGSGTWEIGGYSGGNARFRMTGAGGNLIVNGNLVVTHELDIEAGTLTSQGNLRVTRTGAAEKVTLFAGASIKPGINALSISTITIQNDNFQWSSDNATSGMLFDLSNLTNASDLINITGTGVNEGNFQKGTGSAFLFDFTGGKAGETYTLVNFSATTFSQSDFAVGSGIGGTFTLNSNNLQFTAIPEPSTMFLSTLGVVALLRRRR